VLSLLDALPADPVCTDSDALLMRGELLCQGFEAYRQLLPSGQISFEHAYFLVNSLSCGELLRLANCADCGALMVTERLPLRATRCQNCLS
jgi:ribosomal protein S27E